MKHTSQLLGQKKVLHQKAGLFCIEIYYEGKKETKSGWDGILAAKKQWVETTSLSFTWVTWGNCLSQEPQFLFLCHTPTLVWPKVPMIVVLLWLFLLFERQTKTGSKRRYSTFWFILPMSARAEPGHSERLLIQSRQLLQWHGPKKLSHHLLLSRVLTNRKLDQKQNRYWNPCTQVWGVGLLK